MTTDINKLTIAEAKQRLDEAKDIALALGQKPDDDGPSSNSLASYGVGRKCIIRTCSSGIHFGTVKEREGQELVLENARRIWTWSGAFTLHAVAQEGISGGKLSIVTPEILVAQVIEIQPCSNKVISQLESYAPHDPNN